MRNVPHLAGKATVAAVAALTVTNLTLVPASAAPAPGCRDVTVAPAVEEARLGRTLGADPVPVPVQILRRSGFDRLTTAFERALCATRDHRRAGSLVDRAGRGLWEAAVARARLEHPPGSSLPGDDDRPLYWARLSMTLALRQWTPGFPLPAADRAELEKRLEYASRGITSSGFRAGAGMRKLFVSGFDPFQLDDEIRRGNPSGASVLRLDGRTLRAGGSVVEVQAVVFPVRYGDFDRGIVEDAFRFHLRPGRQRAGMFATVSQGRVGAFDLEVWNGRRRSVSSIGDNNNVWGGGSATAPVVFPGVGPGPEFIASTLPHDRMLAADGQPFTVRRNPSVREIPAGGTAPVVRPDGPTLGSVAVEGSGGGYLSNEVAYRATLLRDQNGGAVLGGHVHTPVLLMDPANAAAVTDPVFERNRAGIARQAELILRLAAGPHSFG